MVTKYIGIGDSGEWGLLLCYALQESDSEEAAGVMKSFGLDADAVDEAFGVLMGEWNSGMCVSRDDVRMSVIFVGRTSSRSQFWNTVNHELMHTGTAIIDYYGVPYSSEEAAYLQGYLLQRVVEEIASPCL